ncbi:hypothetical protein DIPPA_27462 [Diplonema papillatum]|nr:hypothetical protein DIPPA_27462 [Diplonema papillatum]
MAPKKKPASKRTSLSPRSGSSDGSAAVTRIQGEDAVMRPSNDEHTETLAAENAKVEALNAKEEALNAKVEALTAEKKALNAKEEALNAKEEALKDALVARVTKIGGDTDTAQFGIYDGSDTTANALKDALKELKDSLKDKKKSLNAQLESLNAQLEEVQKRLTLRAQAPPQV